MTTETQFIRIEAVHPRRTITGLSASISRVGRVYWEIDAICMDVVAEEVTESMSNFGCGSTVEEVASTLIDDLHNAAAVGEPFYKAKKLYCKRES